MDTSTLNSLPFIMTTNIKSTEMSLTRILAELKVIDVRIEKKINETTFIAAKRGLGEKTQLLVSQGGSVIATASPTPETIESTIISDFQSLTDLINRKTRLKQALVAANAVTKVNISGKEMTIAAAIERKASIATTNRLIQTLKSQFTGTSIFIDKQLQEMNANIDRQQGASKNTNPDVTQSSLDELAESMRNRYTVTAIDPLVISEKIKSMEQDLNDFIVNVDFCLSEVNASTKVNVED